MKLLFPLGMVVMISVTMWYGVFSPKGLPDARWLRGHNDLALHVVALFAITLPVWLRWPTALAVAACASFALFIEGIQMFMPTRTAALDDLLAGALGILLAVGVAQGLRLMWAKRAH